MSHRKLSHWRCTIGTLLHAACSSGNANFAEHAEQIQEEHAALVTGPIVAKTELYGGVWETSTAGQLVLLRRSRQGLVDEYDKRWNEGLRLSALTIQVMDGSPVYGGVWDPSNAGQVLRLDRTFDQFVADYDEWWNNGFRLSELTTYTLGGHLYYSGIWDPREGGQVLRLAYDRAAFLDEYAAWWDSGMRLSSLSTDVVDGQVRYHGVWDPNTSGQYLRLDMTRERFEQENARIQAEGFHLKEVDTYTLDNIPYYNAIWDSGASTQFVALQMSFDEFLTNYDQQWNAGMRLKTLLPDHVTGLALDAVAAALNGELAGHLTGFAATVAAFGERASTTYGLRRTATDGGDSASSPDSRMNLASVSKTITAVAVLQLLLANGLSVDDTVSPWLPRDWDVGPNFDTITFRELLTHRSGIRADANGTGYEGLRATVAGGINVADKSTAQYQNVNFALFRVIVPFLNGLVQDDVEDMNTGTSAAFLRYANDNIFAPAGIGQVTLMPTGEPTLCYPFPAGAHPGDSFGDFSDGAGGAGFQLSSNELAAFLTALHEGRLLPQDEVQRMKRDLLGWQATIGAKYGDAVFHGGFLYRPEPRVELNTLAVSFGSGAQVALEINSPVPGVDVLRAVLDAHDNAWVAAE